MSVAILNFKNIQSFDFIKTKFNDYGAVLLKNTNIKNPLEYENLSPSADVVHKSSNLAISRCCFADDGKERDKNEKCTCRACKATVFAY